MGRKHAVAALIHSCVTLLSQATVSTHNMCDKCKRKKKMLLMQSVTGGTIEGLVMQLCSTRWTRKLSWSFFFHGALTRGFLTALLWTPSLSCSFLALVFPDVYQTLELQQPSFSSLSTDTRLL